MSDTLQLGPEVPGRPTVVGVVVCKLVDDPVPGYCWCDGKSISLLCSSPGEARRFKPLFGRLKRYAVERRTVQEWRSYTPPTMSLVDRLKAALARRA